MVILLFIFNINQAVQGNPPDTIQFQKQPFWENLIFEIGYSGGLCWTGDNLKKANAAPLDVSAKFYWLNSVEGSVSYPLGRGKKVKIGGGYGWTRLTNRQGLSLYLPNEDPNTGYAYVTTSNWDLSTILLHLGFRINNSFFIGGCMNYCIASTNEHLNHHNSDIYTMDTTISVQRKCIGAGIFCGFEGSSLFENNNLKPFIKLQLGWANEYENDAPWEWKERLKVVLSGIFLGVKIEIGGVR